MDSDELLGLVGYIDGKLRAGDVDRKLAMGLVQVRGQAVRAMHGQPSDLDGMTLSEAVLRVEDRIVRIPLRVRMQREMFAMNDRIREAELVPGARDIDGIARGELARLLEARSVLVSAMPSPSELGLVPASK